MKKLISIITVICMTLALAACGSQEVTEDSAAGSTQESSQANSQAEDSEGTASDEEVTAGGKTLVVYFSATGTTKGIAEYIAGELGADTFEIIPAEPYTDADLDYNDDNSRSTQEMNDPSSRPEISGTVPNMEQYDTVYLGYPIWWGEAPRIMDTFVESYDFTDKTVIPFCTSASSGIGSSADNLADLAGTGNWLAGERFSGGESSDEIANWIYGL